MSSGEVSESEKDTLKTVRELLEKAEDSARKALNKAAPAVQKSVETSVDAAAKGFAATMKSIDGATSKEQLELLKAYRKVLGGQVDFVDSRIRALEAKKPAGEGAPEPVSR